jgi:adenine-specific DNA-methyltransferase
MADIERLDLTSGNVTDDKRQELKKVFPEVFTEGNRIDFERLKLVLGENIDVGRERFSLTWAGKADCFKAIQQPSIGTLVPLRDESANFDLAENVFIEGDNLEVLKLLQKAYLGKVKMIYIDPPYNTGHDFIYPDDYSENLATYLKYTRQVDDEGRKYSTLTEADGRFHSKWLSMMLPRLYISRTLLSDDGVIFVSIDEREFVSLRSLMNEVFGEENFVAAITVLCNPKGRSQDKYFATNHEYVLVFSKRPLPKGHFSIEKEEDQVIAEYTEEDDGGRYRLLELRNTHREFGRHNRRNLYYPLYVNAEGDVSLEAGENLVKILPDWDDGYEGCWTWERDRAIRDIEFLVGQQVKGKWKIYRKSYASGAERMYKTIFNDKRYFTVRGQKAFNQLFETKDKIFQSPKSPHLLMDLMRTVTTGDDIILDFFAGSGTTAQAVLELNKQDDGHRRFICVQLPEPTGVESQAHLRGLKTVADICKERIRRVIRKLSTEHAAESDMFTRGQQSLSLGFKVFTLRASNFRIWDVDAIREEAEMKKQLDLYANHLNPESSQDDILFELLLKSGYPLTTKIEPLILAGKTVFSVSDGAFLICLERELTREVIKAIADRRPHRVVCLDVGFGGNDQLKTNALQMMKSKNVEAFRTV